MKSTGVTNHVVIWNYDPHPSGVCVLHTPEPLGEGLIAPFFADLRRPQANRHRMSHQHLTRLRSPQIQENAARPSSRGFKGDGRMPSIGVRIRLSL